MTDTPHTLSEAKRLIAAEKYDAAHNLLCSTISCHADFTIQLKAARLHARIPKATLKLKPIKIAILASSTVDHFAEILVYWLACDGYAATLWVAPFDTMHSTILNRDKTLYAFKADIVWLFTSHRDVCFDLKENENIADTINGAIQNLVLLWQILQSELKCAVIQNNADIPSIDVFGNFAGQALWSQRNNLRRYNLELAAAAPTGVILFDLEHLSALYGKAQWVDSRYWYHSKNAFSFDACGLIAFQASRIISSFKGSARKCLVLDLDNTLWGGVIGDDGLSGIKLGNGAEGEAFIDFQRYVLSLKERGIVLAVCSKNEENNAREPFLNHPDCLLRLEDIAVFRANWNNKVDNIRDIASALNLGLDSFVFVDDNPVERNLVREFLPMVAVPELPEDPTGYMTAIANQHYFETVVFSNEDRERARFYKENAERSEQMSAYTDIGDYLGSLAMTAEINNMDSFHLPRIAQLINKSNQFHLTGTRYSESELQSIAAEPNHIVRYFKLRDRFGDNGLISALILKISLNGDLVIDTWVMSCRVLARTMEEFICNDIIDIARRLGCTAIVGRYVPSAKNGLVATLYERLGFFHATDERETTIWQMPLDLTRPPLITYILPISTPLSGVSV